MPGEEQIEDKVQGYEYRKAYYVWQNGKRLTDSLIRRMETEAEALNRDIQRVDTRPVAEKGK